MPTIWDHSRSLLSTFVRSALTMFNPLTILIPPAILLLSIPLAIFAAATTTLAISILSVRLSIVYFELAIAIIRRWLFGTSPTSTRRSSALRISKISPASSPSLSSGSSPSPPSARAHSRRGSVPQSSSAITTHQPAPSSWSPTINNNSTSIAKRSDSFASLIGPTSGAANRDYEGVAGWKDTAGNDEEALWIGIGMNSRLELPGGPPADAKRRHQRSHTAGSLHKRSSGSMQMTAAASPVLSQHGQQQGQQGQGRARTPVGYADGATESYFAISSAAGGGTSRRPGTAESGMTVGGLGYGAARSSGRRRKSNSSTGSSSSSNSRLTQSLVQLGGY